MIKSDKTIISVKNLGKRYGENEVLKDINLDVKEGEVVSILGPSGFCAASIIWST